MNALEVSNVQLQSDLHDVGEELAQSQEVNSSLKLKELKFTQNLYEQLVHGADQGASPGQCAALDVNS